MSRLRGFALPLAIIATILLAYLLNPWFAPDGALRLIATLAFWVASILLVVALFEDRKDPEGGEVEIEGPRFARFLFNNSRAGLLWLPIGSSWASPGGGEGWCGPLPGRQQASLQASGGAPEAEGASR